MNIVYWIIKDFFIYLRDKFLKILVFYLNNHYFMLSKAEKDYITQLIQDGQELPEDLKYILFPTVQKEYELVYGGKMRKADLLANEDEVFPVPLQIEKVFNGHEYQAFENERRNIIVFGDNLQFLKTIYKNKDEVIKDKIKGKVKLIYIDPPFATTDDFQNKEGAKAYTDKKKGAEFVEFLRRRLILAKEILAEDGSIFVHLDRKKAHYIKLVMDEVFGEKNFINDIVWYYRRWNIASNLFARNHDIILFYAKNKGQHTFNNLFIPKSEKSSGQGRAWESFFDEETGKRKSVLLESESKGVPMPDVWDISMINPVATERKQINYPTQKPEELLERIIKSTTNAGDIVLDFFGGSGTTMAVAEKLGRKRISCDIGKLAYFTEQKRILQIQESKDLNDIKKRYNKKAKSFMTCTLGLYDLKKALDLEWKEYCNFVSGIFEVQIGHHKVSGYGFEGKKGEYYVKIRDYNKNKDSNVDEIYLKSIHQAISNKITGRIYIVAPANHIDFLSDYYDIDGLRYYFLKIPYQVIKDLHKTPFQKLRQPQSKKNINNLDEAIGFHFIKQPEVQSEIQVGTQNITLLIKEFRSQYRKDEEGKILDNFETLSAVFIDRDFDGKQFIMSDSYFADDLLPKKKTNSKILSSSTDEGLFNEDIRKSLKEAELDGLRIYFQKSDVGKRIMVIYTDIYGNDFSEILSV